MKGTITLFAVVFLCITVVSCGKRGARQEAAVNVDDTEAMMNDVLVSSESGIISIDMTGVDHTFLNILKESGQTVTVKLILDDSYNHLTATLTSKDPNANIRFSQIIMPDDEADGPFGREIEYDISQKGEYRLILNENIMAGDPWEGVFTIDINLAKK